MSNIVIGTRGAIEQPIAYKFMPGRGWQTIRKWRGEKAAILVIMSQLSAANWEVDCIGGPVWEVSGTVPLAADGSTEAPVNIWDVGTNKTLTDISLWPTFAALQKTDLDDIDAAIIEAPTVPFTGAKQMLYSFKKIKLNEYVVNQQVVRHTQVVSNSYAVASAYTNVGRILATASLGAPSTLLVGLAPSGASAKPAISDGSTSYAWNLGWLKNPPQVNESAFNKIQIVQDYEYGEYQSYIFGALV